MEKGVQQKIDLKYTKFVNKPSTVFSVVVLFGFSILFVLAAIVKMGKI